jgi:hypothetical protein
MYHLAQYLPTGTRAFQTNFFWWGGGEGGLFSTNLSLKLFVLEQGYIIMQERIRNTLFCKIQSGYNLDSKIF